MADINKESWDKQVIDLGGSILQSWIWGQFQENLGLKIHRIRTDKALALGVETPLVMGKSYLYVPRGPIGETPDILPKLKLLSEDTKLVFARLEPQDIMDLPRALKETQPTHNWILDLDLEEEKLLMNMKPKHRYNINLSSRKGVVIREGKREDLIAVYKLLLETSERNHFRLHPQDYYWQIWDSLAPNNLRILLAEYQGKPLAAMLLTVFGDTAIYLHGGSSSVLKEAMAPYLLHWEAIKLVKNQGVRYYDFGGVASGNDPNHSWSGISRFKKGFGGFEYITPGSYDMVFSPVWYNVYKNARNFRKLIKR